MDVLSEFVVPGREARYGEPPEWLKNSPVWNSINQELTCGQLYRHQAIALEHLDNGSNVVVSTDTASGKSLIFQAYTLHRLLEDPQATAIALYPRKALSRDQHGRWLRFANSLGLDSNNITVINGDVPIEERTAILEQTRLCIMTPDIVQTWLMGYSDLRYTKNERVMHTKEVVRKFIKGLSVIIIDEAHHYSEGIGAHMQYLMPRLFHKHRQLDPSRPHPQIIAASATIASPAEHLQKITKKRFVNVPDSENGAPKAPLTVQHVLGRSINDGGWEDAADTITEILGSSPKASYIAFIDNRQLAERAAAKIEPAVSILENEVIDESSLALSYRGGLMFRDRIEEKLWTGRVRGITSTSAMEMGIDVPELNVGLNLGAPESMRSLKQRAGRVGRNQPGTFIIVAPADAFADHENSLERYWNQEPEAPAIYTENPYIKAAHAKSLLIEDDWQVHPLEHDESDHNDPDDEVIETINHLKQAGKHEDPEMLPANKRFPHKSGLANSSDIPTTIEALVEQPATYAPLTKRTHKGDAIREAYPLATYWHQKRPFTVERWHETTNQYGVPQLRIQCRPDAPRETRPLKSKQVTVNFPTKRATSLGRLQYSSQQNTVISEVIYGCKSTDLMTGRSEELLYDHYEIPQIETVERTMATTAVIWEPWFNDPETRAAVTRALKQTLCRLEGINPSEIGTAHEDVYITSNGVTRLVKAAVVIYDAKRGGLGLSRILAERFLEYTEHILDLAQRGEEHDARAPRLGVRTAQLLHDWAKRMDAEDAIKPVVSQYAGTLFRSNLEAEWAQRLDKLNIEWEYEPPEPMPGWLPDFHITTSGGFQAMAEVKPCTELPESQIKRIADSGYCGNALILGATGDHKWIRTKDGWEPIKQFPP